MFFSIFYQEIILVAYGGQEYKESHHESACSPEYHIQDINNNKDLQQA